MASSDALRLKILRVAHSEYPRSVERAFILTAIKNVEASEIEREVFYLEDRRLVRLGKEMGKLWTELEITADGIDIVEGKREL